MKIVFIRHEKLQNDQLYSILNKDIEFIIAEKGSIPLDKEYYYIVVDDGRMQEVIQELKIRRKRYFCVNSVSINNPVVINRIVNNILNIKEPPRFVVSNLETTSDQSALIHGIQKHVGMVSPINVPMIFSKNGHNMWFENMFSGKSAFLILGGPSFAKVDYKKLDNPGFITMSVNNVPRTYRTNLWVSVDDPTHFMKSIWLDPRIMKFVPFTHTKKKIFDNEKWQMSELSVGDCPNVWYYRRNEYFDHEKFMFEDTFNWGNSGEHGGGRSVMLVAIRMLYYLGIRNVFLLGCDFKMDQDNKYHFKQDRSTGSIQNNNNTYMKLIHRFEKLKPIFSKLKYNVYNCNQESNLKVFPYMSFEESLKIAMNEIPDINNEKSEGLYDRSKE